MGMETDVILCHYIEIIDFKKNEVQEIESLHDVHDLEDEFVSHTHLKEDIVTSNYSDEVFHWTRYDNDCLREVTIDLINQSHMKFLINMRKVINYLEENNCKFKVKFGILSTTN